MKLLSKSIKTAAKTVYAAFNRNPSVVKMIAKHFHRSWYASDETYLKTRWRGVRILKCPLDLWVYQEILHATRPDLVIETGTGHGGSAYYFASLFDLPKHGEIITIDIEKRAGLPIHPRITYLNGSATDPAIIATVRQAALGKTSVMAVLDSDHSEAHALEELRSFSPLVTEGNYLVVEDTHIGHPVPPFSQTGPMQAVRRFLQENNEFGIDANCERLLMSFNYQGYLKRIKPSPTGSIHGST